MPGVLPQALACRPVHPDECMKVADLHRASFPREQVLRTIYASPYVHRYLEEIVTSTSLIGSHTLYGVWAGDNLLGYAHCRDLTGSWHLNQIAVLPSYQGKGIGRVLWERYIELGRERGHKQITLDVERDNLRSSNWYRHKGLQVVATTWAYEKQIVRQPAAEYPAQEIQVMELEAANAHHSIYGFSQFRLVYKGKTWTIGRLGEYFRATEELPADVVAALKEIDDKRLLLILSSTPIKKPGLIEVGVSYRMSGALPPKA